MATAGGGSRVENRRERDMTGIKQLINIEFWYRPVVIEGNREEAKEDKLDRSGGQSDPWIRSVRKRTFKEWQTHRSKADLAGGRE